MTMYARVLEVQEDQLLVYDTGKAQEVIVHTSIAHCFCVGNCVMIKFSGVMTMSIPPQITATCITKVRSC